MCPWHLPFPSQPMLPDLMLYTGGAEGGHDTGFNIQDNMLEIYPNKQDKTCCLPYCQSEAEIFREIVEATKNLIFKLNEEEKKSNLEVKLDKVIATLKDLKRKKRRVVILRNIRGRKRRVSIM